MKKILKKALAPIAAVTILGVTLGCSGFPSRDFCESWTGLNCIEIECGVWLPVNDGFPDGLGDQVGDCDDDSDQRIPETRGRRP